MANIITTAHLTKSYGGSRGIVDVSFTVEEGEVFGFLGPNGAGKTTTMRVLMGLLHANAGSATIGDLDVWAQSTAVKKLIGYLPGELSLDPALTGAQILAYLGNLRGGMDQTYLRQLIDRLGVDPSKRFREYSRGNKQKIGLIQAFMHRPRLLILDEPTSGLDPLNQQEFYAMVKEVRADGRTVFLSSHVLPEVEHTCDRVGIIREGSLVTVDRISAVRDLKRHIVDITFPGDAQVGWFSAIASAHDVAFNGDQHTIHLTAQGDLSEVIRAAAQHGATNIEAREPSLEEVFLRYYEPTQS
ncbi:MAG: ABC transporter ATP-binding protein [Ktedonobacterales bacterium]|nr:ABC transporter ATP-binding protein [Ktedonobacterales bacterium]